jgi:hypothetical protein
VVALRGDSAINNQLPSINLIVQIGPDPGQVFAVQKDTQTIGRSLANDIAIPEPSLSRQHARIWIAPYGFVIEDLGSTNGTFVNRQRVTGPTPLRPGDTLQLGDGVTLSVQPGQPSPGDQITLMADSTLVPGRPSPGAPDSTFVPATPSPPPIRYPPARGSGPWIWIGVIVATILMGGAIIGGLYYYLTVLDIPHPKDISQTQMPPEISQTPTAVQTQPVLVEPPSLPTPTATPLPVPEAVTIVVGGVPALTAEEGEPPENITGIDAGCNRQVEISADEPLILRWSWTVAEDSETGYLAQWLEAAYYDVRLDGVPITELGSLNYYRTEGYHANNLRGPALEWWVKAGILPAGAHRVTIESYTTRAVSDGFDVDPADGQLDIYGPGLVDAGFCDISVVAVEVAAPTPEVSSTPTPGPTSTPKPVATQTPVVAAPPGIFQDFENESIWKRGDQPYGEFSRSTAQVHGGQYAGQLTYNFPSPDNDYVIFLQSRPLAGQPNAISAWVYGDGSGHFLNIWIKDAAGQTWQMTFGQVKHTGWQQMAAILDPGQPWPSGHISGPDNGAIDYPISFQALVLDDVPDTYSGSGTIYIDDLSSQEGAAPPTPTAIPPIGAPTPTPGGQPEPVGSGVYVLRIGSQHRYEEPWGAPKDGNPCRAWESGNWDDENPNFRGFNVELLLTNNSTTKVQDDWGENMRFFTAGGQEVTACYYGYAGVGPPPGGTTSLTFFSVVPKGDYVQIMQLNLNGQFIQICLDGRGGWSPC